MLMPGRTYSTSSYRYGFNGKEKDNSITNLTDYDYGFRIYNPAIGKFLSLDPLTRTYPWYTPYQFAGNKPTWATDLDGLEENTTSTYLYHPPILALKPTFNGVIAITDATSQTAHKAFEGNFAQLRKADQTGLGASVVSQLTGTNYGTKDSKLDITMKSTRSQVFKSWKGTDIKYFTQYSYTFTSNNVIETGTFELQVGQIEASARAWDPLLFLLVNKAISSIVASGINIPTRLVRVVPVNVQATTLARTTETDAFVANPAELKGLNADQIARKLTLKNADGSYLKGPFKLIEFDTPTEGLAQPLNRTNPGFVNGGKTAGGATEYVVPNRNIKELKNVTESVVN